MENKEKMTVKEFIKRYKKEILAGVVMGGAAIGFAVILKNNQTKIIELSDSLNEEINKNDKLSRRVISVENMNNYLYEDNATLSSILSEGVIQDAIQTTKNKINGRENRIAQLEKRLGKTPGDSSVSEKLVAIKMDLQTLIERLSLYETKLAAYEIVELEKEKK